MVGLGVITLPHKADFYEFRSQSLIPFVPFRCVVAPLRETKCLSPSLLPHKHHIEILSGNRVIIETDQPVFWLIVN